MLLAFNYQREESVMDFYDAEGLSEALEQAPLEFVQVMKAGEEDVHEVINTTLKQPAFWKLFIIFALLILLLEVLILRLWK